jgi:hypothetical protein
VIDWLHSVSAWLENWCDRHSHTIALLEAVSTTAAVIVALVASAAAKRAIRPKLRASVSIMQLVPGDGRPASEWKSYVAVRLTNVGTVPVRLQATFKLFIGVVYTDDGSRFKASFDEEFGKELHSFVTQPVAHSLNRRTTS